MTHHIDFTSDGRSYRYSDFRDGQTVVRETATGGKILDINQGGNVAFSPDGRSLAFLVRYSARQISISSGSRRDEHQLGPGLYLLRVDREGEKPYPVLGGEDPRNVSDPLRFSPDGRWLLTGGKVPPVTNVVMVWEVSSGRRVATLEVSPYDGRIEDIQFSANGNRLAASCITLGSARYTVKAWNVPAWNEVLKIEVVSLHFLALSPDGRTLAVLVYESGYNDVQRMNLEDGKWLPRWNLSFPTQSVSYSPNGKWVAVGGDDGAAHLLDAQGREVAMLLTSAETDDWVAVTPQGLFDGSPEILRNLVAWRFGEEVLPAEVFFNEFYQPGVLADVLSGKTPPTRIALGNVDRRQPLVAITMTGAEGGDKQIAERTVALRVEASEAPRNAELTAGSGVRDVRVFRNGSLVKVWRGDVLQGKGGKVTLETTVPIIAGENRFTAYAFNRDNVKSSDANLVVTGADSLKRPGTVYILAVGINEYANKDYSLNYAVADAQAFGEELARQQTKLKNFASVQVISLLNRDATKANILRALARLAGTDTGPLPAGAPADLQKIKPAEPEDAVFVYYAGHGTAAGPRFYLIPHDLGYEGSRIELDEAGLKAILTHSISDVDLEQAFEKVDAGRLLLVIDACNSGQALETEEKRRGPMNSKGLVQLAYEKGMYILTAAQGYQAALEAAQLGHGFLTYALVQEGLKTAAADTAPKDGQVVSREWLDYATLRVPQMQETMMQEARKLGRDVAFVEGEQTIKDLAKRSLQRPRVFYRREPESEPLIVAKPEANP